jgi:ADP-ribose pyrophosphatase YjhB (NUDIX family)
MSGIGFRELRRLHNIDVPLPEQRDWSSLPVDYCPVVLRRADDMPQSAYDFDTKSPLEIARCIARMSITPPILDHLTGLPRNPRGATGTVGGPLWYRVNPSASLLARHGNDVLLVRLKATGLWALPGGFLHTNSTHTRFTETVEQAALREAAEEAGVVFDPNDAKRVDTQCLPDDPRDTDDRWVEERLVYIDASSRPKSKLRPAASHETVEAAWVALQDAPLDEMSSYFAEHLGALRAELGQRAIIVA